MYPISNASPQHVADWAEWYVAHSQETLSKTSLSTLLAQGLSLDDTGADELVESVWLELRLRERLYGPNAPIKVAGRVLRSQITWTDNPPYLACLIFSLTGNSTQTTVAGQLFEELSAVAVKRYIGGECVICGFPNSLKVKDLADYVGEKFVQEFPSHRKDRNLDLMAWLPFGDARPGQLIVLVQCAAGRNWKEKTKELALRAWERLIHFHVSPVRGFTMPYVLSDASDFEEHSIDAGIILDRVRIYRHTHGVALNAALKKRLTAWCKGRVTAMNKN